MMYGVARSMLLLTFSSGEGGWGGSFGDCGGLSTFSWLLVRVCELRTHFVVSASWMPVHRHAGIE